MDLEAITGPATEKVSAWIDQLVAMLPNIVAAVVALILFWIAAVETIEERDRERDVEIYYVSFDDYAIRFSLRFWIDFPEQNFLHARSEAIIRVKRAFDENGITIPFPIRTLDFATVGGRTLAQAIPRSMKGNSS